MPSVKFFQLSLDSDLAEIMEAMKADASLGKVGGFVTVTNNNQVVVGVITYKEILNAKMKFGISSNFNAGQIMRRDFIYILEGTELSQIPEVLQNHFNLREIKNTMPITYIPILSSRGELRDIKHLASFVELISSKVSDTVVIGQGFVGLTLSLVLAENGKQVFAVEEDLNKVLNIRSLDPGVFEPNLVSILERKMGKEYQIFSSLEHLPPRKNILASRTFIVSVGTPIRDNLINLEPLEKAILSIAQQVEFGDLVIIRSTVPVGTTRDLVANTILKICGLKAGIDYSLVYGPERTVEGNAINEIKRLPQLIAGFTESCASRGVKFFASFVSSCVITESLEACELAKLASNAYRDVSFGFANEIARLAHDYAVDINKLITDANTGYHRNAIPSPSPGVGGPCLTKDSYILSKGGPNSVSLAARLSNETMITFVANRIAAISKGKNILVVGVAFKGDPPTNDIRLSTSVDVIKELERRAMHVRVVDGVCSFKELNSYGLKVFNNEAQEFCPDTIAILNNYIGNLLLVEKVVNLYSGKEFVVFDPWNIIKSFGSQKNKVELHSLSKKLS